MEHWKQTIEAGNARYHAGDLIEAREHYLRALAQAQLLFTLWPDADEAVAAVVVSSHNLADLHVRLDQAAISAGYLCAVHERLLRTQADPQLPPALRAAALRHSNRTYAELLAFARRHGDPPRVRGLLDRAPAAGPAPARPSTLPALRHRPGGPSHGP